MNKTVAQLGARSLRAFGTLAHGHQRLLSARRLFWRRVEQALGRERIAHAPVALVDEPAGHVVVAPSRAHDGLPDRELAPLRRRDAAVAHLRRKAFPSGPRLQGKA